MTLPSRLRSIFQDWRIGRIIMFILITGSVTYSLGGSPLNIALAGIIGATLSAAGFRLDYLADHKKDRATGKMSNPIARGAVSPQTSLSIVVLCLATSAILSIFVNPWISSL